MNRTNILHYRTFYVDFTSSFEKQYVYLNTILNLGSLSNLHVLQNLTQVYSEFMIVSLCLEYRLKYYDELKKYCNC